MPVVLAAAAFLLSAVFPCSLESAVGDEMPGAQTSAPEGPPLSPGTQDIPVLNDKKWLHAETDAAARLTRYYPDPLASTDKGIYLIELGRLAFRNPLLLGGVAAREGLTCATCHPGGGRNASFYLAGLSSGSGTVDVTTSLFSKALEDGEFNPVKIPSLVDVGQTAPYGHAGQVAELPEFVRHVIVEEFAGEEPQPVVFDALLSYLRALRSAELAPPESLRVQHIFGDIGRSLSTLEQTIARRDVSTSLFIIHGIRRDLGVIAERYPGAEHAEVTAALERASGRLRQIRNELNTGAFGQAKKKLAAFGRDLKRAAKRARKNEKTSLFNEAALRRKLSPPAGEPAVKQ